MLTKKFIEQAVSDTVFVSPILNERIGNNVLQIYRGFWFAAVHGVPRDRVFIKPTGDVLAASSMMGRISSNFLDAASFDRLAFYRIHCCPDSTTSVPDGRRALVDMEMPERGGVGLSGAGFLYPELPWERSLFVQLFDNPEMRNSLASEYAAVLCGNTIGYVIRRGDFQHLPQRRRLTTEAIVADLSRIAEKHYGMVRIIVTSDDPDFVDTLLRDNSFLRKYVFLYRADPVSQMYLLSLCDYVISHRAYQCTSCWVTDPDTLWESTFGQMAQILNRSYKYASFPAEPSAASATERELTRSGCDCCYPRIPRINGGVWA